VVRGWRRLHNEELHNLYTSPNIVRVIKSGRIKWTGHVAWMGEMKSTLFWMGSGSNDYWYDKAFYVPHALNFCT
jgi:hypothetical protein